MVIHKGVSLVQNFSHKDTQSYTKKHQNNF